MNGPRAVFKSFLLGLALALAGAGASSARAGVPCASLFSYAEFSAKELRAIGAGLHYETRFEGGIERKGGEKDFTYVGPDGKRVRDEATLKRIAALGIPAVHKDVWISSDPLSHIQAIAVDARGRKQYYYHAEWIRVSAETKFGRMVEFGESLPRIRDQAARDLAQRGFPKTRALALAVRLLESTMIRVGNEEYAEENQSFGLTTLEKSHLKLERGRALLSFTGKSGVHHDKVVEDRQLVALITELSRQPGDTLLQYEDANGTWRPLRSDDVNDYIKETSGGMFSAKDFRTWVGTVTAAEYLHGIERPSNAKGMKLALAGAAEAASQRLGNTPSVARSSYIHPAILSAYESGDGFEQAFARASKRGANRSVAEKAVLELISAR